MLPQKKKKNEKLLQKKNVAIMDANVNMYYSMQIDVIIFEVNVEIDSTINLIN